MKKTTLIIMFSLLIMSIWAQREDFSCTISITQNASGRLGTMDKADEDAYRQAKQMLRNPNSTKKQLRRSGKALRGIYKKKSAEMKLIMKEVAEKTGITFSLEDAGGTWLGGEEYSFKVAIEAPSQDAYDKALQAISYVAEATSQDAFIENLGEVDESEITDEGLLNGDYTPFVYIPFTRRLSQQELAVVQDVFNMESSDDIPLDATITKDEICFSLPTWKLGENPTIKDYQELYNQWSNKIKETFSDGKEGNLKGLVGETYGRRYEKSRFHQADNAYSEEPTRDYTNQRNHYVSERKITKEGQGLLPASEGQAIKSYVTKLLLRK